MTTDAGLSGRTCRFSSFIEADEHQTSFGIEETAATGACKVSYKN